MYGIVNKAIQGLVTENFGLEKWNQIKVHSGIADDLFISNEPYDDSITYKLAGSASHILGLSLREVLLAFGRYWIHNTGHQHYGSLMLTGGRNLREFLINLPNFHSRVMLVYPSITPPEFRTQAINEKELHIHYYSTRMGLTDFAEGLIIGLAEAFHESVSVALLQAKKSKDEADIFKISW
ncbi:heme NO-binding domain-containing protein [Xanthocytophaga agilis]|uniref:Heme NO-binding domain-containing protein n=1 Tax=Xanthocytophaga agilis TaxID=3048010 RepID=A0AAE3UFF4_9BACT|nr:heme NO-binding domain-containing protein [Xanthocytophaga agilis]MDJ1502366.1 heme NO-binding domain-containing protein [Xanthocytophaga agilis]